MARQANKQKALLAAAGVAAIILGAWFLTMKRSALTTANPNAAAFLAMLRHSEGTDQYADPWGTYYGGSQFSDKSDHPVLTGSEIPVAGPSGVTTAAGAYQITLTTWEALGGALHYGDFSDAAQDAAALDLIEGRGATPNIIAGDFAGAVALLGKEWASLPGSPYGQPTHTLADLQQVYLDNGGSVA
jgi:muramidase (phage lysozyme)